MPLADINIDLLSNQCRLLLLVTKEVDNDTLHYWFKPNVDLDSLNFTMSHQTRNRFVYCYECVKK